MAWFAANWFWVLIFIAFVGMHAFGHGGHGGHGGHRGRDPQRTKGDGDTDADNVEGRSTGASTRSGGQQH